MAYTRAGLTPDGSSTYFLPRIVGLKRALELTMTNRLLSAQEAEQWGIVTKVVSDATLQTEADALAGNSPPPPPARLAPLSGFSITLGTIPSKPKWSWSHKPSPSARIRAWP